MNDDERIVVQTVESRDESLGCLGWFSFLLAIFGAAIAYRFSNTTGVVLLGAALGFGLAMLIKPLRDGFIHLSKGLILGGLIIASIWFIFDTFN